MIENQVALVGQAVDDFYFLINHYNSSNTKQRAKYVSAIRKKERYDDVLYSKIVTELKETFITPMDREDIHQLVVTFDTLIDTLELLALKLSAYDIKKTDPYIKKQTKLLVKAYSQIQRIILSIRREKEVEKTCRAIRKTEQEADNVYMDALKYIFKDSQKPVNIIKLQDIYTSLEKMIDQIQEAALIVESFSVKYS